MLERFYAASPGNLIQCELPEIALSPVAPAPVSSSERSSLMQGNLSEVLDAFEKQPLEEALQRCSAIYQLAEYLGISQPTVFRHLRKHGLSTR